jgi:hypothetical protein
LDILWDFLLQEKKGEIKMKSKLAQIVLFTGFLLGASGYAYAEYHRDDDSNLKKYIGLGACGLGVFGITFGMLNVLNKYDKMED